MPTQSAIEWEFATSKTLEAMYVWNHRSTSPPASDDGYEVTVADFTFFDTSNNVVLLELEDVVLAPNTATAQAIDLGGPVAGVRTVSFDLDVVESSASFAGLAEVAFEGGNTIPEPASLAMLSLGGFAIMHRRVTPTVF